MKIEWTLWLGATAFATLIAIVYAIVAHEPIGVTLLVCSLAFQGLIAGWTTWWRRSHGPRPSDDTDGDAGDDAGPVGAFAAASLRPLVMALGMTGIVLGLVMGIWMTLVGVAIVVSQVALLVRDIDS